VTLSPASERCFSSILGFRSSSAWRGARPAELLIGCITGLLLSLADNEGSLASRVRLTLIVAGGIAVGAFLGVWLKSFEAIFWIAFFLPCSLPVF